MPELAVEITALRRGQKAMALGDVLGSCFIDASLSLGIGPLLFPISVSAAYALKGSAVAAYLLAYRLL